MIRPPPALPGLAQVDVRAADEVTAVSLQAALAATGPDAAPAPVAAGPVRGDAHLYHAELWLFRDGAYKVSVVVESAGGGKDTIILPLASAAPVKATPSQCAMVGPVPAGRPTVQMSSPALPQIASDTSTAPDTAFQELPFQRSTVRSPATQTSEGPSDQTP